MLRAKSFELQRFSRVTLGTGRKDRCLRIAEVASQLARFSVISEGDVAMRAFHHPAARRANLHPVIAAPVQEKEGLLASFDSPFDPPQEIL